MPKPPQGRVRWRAVDPKFTIKIQLAFALIIQSFARLEHLIEMTISAVGNIEYEKATILTAGLGYQGKRDALFGILGTANITESQIDEIRAFLDEANKFNSIRNFIAHSIWVAGTRSGSIKPLAMRVRGNLKYMGVLDSERDYTESDLIGISDKLALINNSYTAFLRRSGLTSRIDAEIENIMQRSGLHPHSEGR